MRGYHPQDLRVCLYGEILSADTSILNFEVLIRLKILKSNDVERCRTLFVYCRNMFPKFDARPFDACRPTEVAYSNDTQNDVERHHWFLGFSYRFRSSGLIACNHQE